MQMPPDAEHGVVGPTGDSRPGPPGRPVLRLAVAGVLVALAAVAVASLDEPSGTQALFTSRAATQTNKIQGAIWAPDPPAACGPVASYHGIIWGTPGDDVLHGGNQPQIIMGLEGNDTIYGGNSGDCLVGGPGDDRLIGGNGKDVLLGGAGNDYLVGGNAKDGLDGGEDIDVCDGGNGADTLVGCEYERAIVPAAPLISSPVVPAPKASPSGTGEQQVSTTGAQVGVDPGPSAPAPQATDDPSGNPPSSPAAANTSDTSRSGATAATSDPTGPSAPVSPTASGNQ